MICQKLSELYNRHLEKLPRNEHFVSCGIVDETVYKSCSPKLVFVLKEVNDPERARRWSMVKFLQRQVEKGLSGKSIYPMWKDIGIWSYAIHNNFPRYNDINTFKISAEGLKYIGMTNLKKSGGGGVADYWSIREYAKNTVDLWKSELEIMRPDVILCCGNFGIVSGLLELSKTKAASGCHYSIWKHNNDESILVSIYHPASRVRKDMLYAFMKEVMLELKEKNFWHG